MTVRSKNSAASSNVSPPVIIATVVLLLIVVGGLAFHFFGPGGGGATSAPPPSDNDKWMTQKAMECKGDARLLSQADQQKLMQVGGIDAPMKLKDIYTTSLATAPK